MFMHYARGDAMLSPGEFCRFLGETHLEETTRAMLPNSITHRVFYSNAVRSVAHILDYVRLNVGHVFEIWQRHAKETDLRASSGDADLYQERKLIVIMSIYGN